MKTSTRTAVRTARSVADDMIADAREHGDSSLDKSYVIEHVVDSLAESPAFADEVVRAVAARGFLNKYN